MIDLSSIETFKVIDDFIPKKNQDFIDNLLNGRVEPFPWYPGKNTSVENNDYIMKHIFVWDGQVESFDFIDDIGMNFIQNSNITNGIIRLRAVLSTRSGKKEYNDTTPHIDIIDQKHYNCVYYVNDSDGDTILYNEDKSIMTTVSPKKGRAVFFNGNILHEATRPKDYSKRIILNINYEDKP